MTESGESEIPTIINSSERAGENNGVVCAVCTQETDIAIEQGDKHRLAPYPVCRADAVPPVYSRSNVPS